MLFPLKQEFNKLTFSIDAAAALIFLMRKQRDAFGLSVFSDKYDFYSPAKSSLTHQRFILSSIEKLSENKYNEKELETILNRSAHILEIPAVTTQSQPFLILNTPLLAKFAEIIVLFAELLQAKFKF